MRGVCKQPLLRPHRHLHRFSNGVSGQDQLGLQPCRTAAGSLCGSLRGQRLILQTSQIADLSTVVGFMGAARRKNELEQRPA
jgi:hypothetical protein